MDQKREAITWIVPIALVFAMTLYPPVEASEFEPIPGDGSTRSNSQQLRATGDSTTKPAEALALDCRNARLLVVGEEVSGDTTGLTGSVDSYGCGNEPETGPEEIFRLDLNEPTLFEITIESDVDLDLILLDECNAELNCLVLGDTGIRSLYPVSGRFYVVVDGYAGAEGPYALRVTEFAEARIPQDFCPTTLLKREFGARSWWGTTCTASNQISGLLCSSAPAYGQESQAELFEVEPGGSLTANLTDTSADLAIYLIGGCEDVSECLQGADLNFVGGDEVLEWTNHSTQNRVVSLVVDTVGLGMDCAEFHMSVEGDLTPIPSGENSWSMLKSWFADPGGRKR